MSEKTCGNCSMQTDDGWCRMEGSGASVRYVKLPSPGQRHYDCPKTFWRHMSDAKPPPSTCLP